MAAHRAFESRPLPPPPLPPPSPGQRISDEVERARAAELARVRTRELGRLLWRGAYACVGGDGTILRGVRAVAIEAALVPAPFPGRVEVDPAALGKGAWREESLEEDLAFLTAWSEGGARTFETARELARRAVLHLPGTVDLRRWAAFEWADGAPERSRRVLRRALDDLLDGPPDPRATAAVLFDLARLSADVGAVHQAGDLLLEAERQDPGRPDVAFEAWRLALRLDASELAKLAEVGLRGAPARARAGLPDALRRLETDGDVEPSSRLARERVVRAAAEEDALGRFSRAILDRGGRALAGTVRLERGPRS